MLLLLITIQIVFIDTFYVPGTIYILTHLRYTTIYLRLIAPFLKLGKQNNDIVKKLSLGHMLNK